MSLKFYSPPRKKAARPEARLQRTVVQHLLLNDAFFMSIANEGKRSAIMGHELKLMGMLPGAADLLIVVDGKAHFLEVKSAEGVQSAAQRDFQARCVMLNIPYQCVFSLTEALSTLAKWGAIKPVKVAA